MPGSKTLAEWLDEKQIDVAHLIETTGLDERIVAAILAGRYTTSPKQRARVAAAVGVDVDQIRWGRAVEVDSMYGHGPQFGRSP